MHTGTTCLVSAPNHDFDDEQVMILSYSSTKSKWLVQLQRPKWKGKELWVPESTLRLAFCLLPEAIGQCKQYVPFLDERAQGSCGRGLAVAAAVAPGEPIFEEPPLVLSPTSSKTSHEDRWKAYITLSMNAHSDQVAAAALDAFDDLGICDRPNVSVEAAASRITDQALALSQQSFSAEDRQVRTAQVRDALMKFQSNQFKYDNASPPSHPRFSASSVFRLTSRLNHSCKPSAFVEVKSSPHNPGRHHPPTRATVTRVSVSVSVAPARPSCAHASMALTGRVAASFSLLRVQGPSTRMRASSSARPSARSCQASASPSTMGRPTW